MTTTIQTPEQAECLELLASITKALHEVYKPEGVLMFWSARIRYLDGQRPCDVWTQQNLLLLRRLDQHANALSDGAFA